MSIKSKIRTKKQGVIVFSIFYAVTGGAQALLLIFSRFLLIHVGFLAVLSLISAYSLMKMKRWSVLLSTALFSLGTTFGTSTLYASIMQQTFYPNLEMLLFHSVLILYLIMAAIAFIFVVVNRGSFQ